MLTVTTGAFSSGHLTKGYSFEYYPHYAVTYVKLLPASSSNTDDIMKTDIEKFKAEAHLINSSRDAALRLIYIDWGMSQSSPCSL